MRVVTQPISPIDLRTGDLLFDNVLYIGGKYFFANGTLYENNQVDTRFNKSLTAPFHGMVFIMRKKVHVAIYLYYNGGDRRMFELNMISAYKLDNSVRFFPWHGQ